MRVLVTWGTKRGGTEGIAQIIARQLRERGHDVVAEPARTARPASDRIVDGMTPPDEVIAGSGNFSLIGPFVDWYFNPHRGLHFQAAVGGATVRGYDLVEARNEPDAVSVGGGVMFGFGYEWWVSHKWGFGVLGRLTTVGALRRRPSRSHRPRHQPTAGVRAHPWSPSAGATSGGVASLSPPRT